MIDADIGDTFSQLRVESSPELSSLFLLSKVLNIYFHLICMGYEMGKQNLGLSLSPETITLLKKEIYDQVLEEDERILDETDIENLAVAGTLKADFYALVKPRET